MKTVMISIHPEWCELILSGKKTLEVRKSRPKLETPFKVYIYCTQGFGKNTLNIPIPFEKVRDDYIETGSMVSLNCPIGNCKVIGEFVCDSIRQFDVPYPAYQNKLDRSILEQSGLSYYQLHRYAYHDKLYGWHISNLKVYNKPKELAEFHKLCISPEFPYCPNCPLGGEHISEAELEFLAIDGECSTEWYCNNRLKKPPQSWCYVEEVT